MDTVTSEDLTNVVTGTFTDTTTNETTTVEPIVAPVVPTKNDLLRDISKEYGINLFDAEGLTKFKEYQDSQKTELDKKQETIDAYKVKETEWQSKETVFNSKLKASELGIPTDKLDDALKLAGGNPDNLAGVIKKYPMFASKEGIQIGVTTPEVNNTSGKSEQELYAEKWKGNRHFHPKIQK